MSMDGPSSKIAPAFSIFPPSVAVISRDAYKEVSGRAKQGDEHGCSSIAIAGYERVIAVAEDAYMDLGTPLRGV